LSLNELFVEATLDYEHGRSNYEKDDHYRDEGNKSEANPELRPAATATLVTESSFEEGKDANNDASYSDQSNDRSSKADTTFKAL